MSGIKEAFDKFLADKKSGIASKRRLQYRPNNEWGHKSSLINLDEIQNVEQLSEFLNKNMALAFISDDYQMMIKSRELRLTLIPLFQMKIREKEDKVAKECLDDLFIFFYGGFMGEMTLTRAKDGMERMLQAQARPEKKESAGYNLDAIRNANKEDDNYLYP